MYILLSHLKFENQKNKNESREYIFSDFYHKTTKYFTKVNKTL